MDDPRGAGANDADTLVQDVIQRRSYPVCDFEQNATNLSVDHPGVVQNYRIAHEIATRDNQGQGNTEDLRKAMVSYRMLFEDLLGQGAEQPEEVSASRFYPGAPQFCTTPIIAASPNPRATQTEKHGLSKIGFDPPRRLRQSVHITRCLLAGILLCAAIPAQLRDSLAERRRGRASLTFQTGTPWTPRTNLNADVAMVYGIEPRRIGNIRRQKQHGYIVHN